MSNTEDMKKTFEHQLEELERVRDELRVRLHLGAADARDEWDKMERKWEQVEQEMNRLGDRARGPIKEIGTAARTLLDELKVGYSRVKERLDR